MFDILLGRKFSKKSKHLMKCIKCRIEAIRKKRQAMVRYFQKDIADLLAGGHDVNAFGRMDALIVEVNLISCYDMIEQYCGCVLKHLSTMLKQRECPKEAMEAVATLIFAAARLSNLPELADLRTEFTERYGTQMESCINTEFVEKTQKKSFSEYKKLQLMEDIAQEFSVNWNAKMFPGKISNQTAPTHVHQTNHKHVAKETDKHFHIREVANENHELSSKKHEERRHMSSMQKHQLQLEECCMNSMQKHQVMIRESVNADSDFPEQKVRINTKNNQNKNDLIFEDRTSVNLDEFTHFKTFEDGKNVIHRNGEDRWHNRPVNAANRRTFNLQPHVKSQVNKSPLHIDYVNPRDYEKSNGGRDDDHCMGGSTHLRLWDYESLAAEIAALSNSSKVKVNTQS